MSRRPDPMVAPGLRRVAFAGLALLALTGCAGRKIRRFPLAPPMWNDPDRRPLEEKPAKYYSGINGDGADKLLLYPMTKAFTFRRGSEAVNVNALDEVPNSSWFENRIGWFDISPERAARAECGDTPPLDPKGPWLVVGAKPNGANPGFFIKGPRGDRYLLKFDGYSQPLRATTADVVGSKIYWLLGYHSVCNEVVEFDPAILKMAPDAEAENQFGDDIPMTDKHVAQVLAKGFRLKDGRMRASASRFVPGKPLGPYTYEGTRSDDGNDVIPHDDRRELRAAQLPAAWLNHIDVREQNSLNVLITKGKQQYIRHYKIDWGDCLGLGWEPDRLARRFGHSYAVDFQHMGEDLLTLGLLDRPWNTNTRSRVEIFGYYDVDSFVPSRWRAVYAIPAFTRRTRSDVQWMVRILSRITDDHIKAIVAQAKLPDARQSKYLTKTLIGRRDRFFHEYLVQHSPLSRFRMARRKKGKKVQSVCFEDLAVKHGIVSGDVVHYKMRFYGGPKLQRQLGWLQFSPDPDHPSWSCIQLPLGSPRPADLAPRGAAANHPLRYGVLRLWVHQGPTILPMSETRLHFYDQGAKDGFQLVGIERPDYYELPDDYSY